MTLFRSRIDTVTMHLMLAGYLAVAADGSLYIADYLDNRVIRVWPGGREDTAAGTGDEGFSGDGGPGVEANLNGPMGLAVGADGSLYIADTNNHSVRRVAPDGRIERKEERREGKECGSTGGTRW